MTHLVNLVQSNHLEILAESHQIIKSYVYRLNESIQAKRPIINLVYKLNRNQRIASLLRIIVRRLCFDEIRIFKGLNDKNRIVTTIRYGLYLHVHNSYWTHYPFLLNNSINHI